MGKRLYVGNLSYQTDDAALREAFSQEGRKVINVHVVMDRDTGRPRGFAFVEMASDEDATAAMAAMDGQELGGRMLRVSMAEDRRPGGPPGASRGPRPTGGFSSAPRPGGTGAPRPSSGGAPRPAGGPAPGGDGAGTRWREDKPPASRVPEKKAQPKRKHDEEEDYGGKRGGRRFDSDDDEEW